MTTTPAHPHPDEATRQRLEKRFRAAMMTRLDPTDVDAYLDGINHDPAEILVRLLRDAAIDLEIYRRQRERSRVETERLATEGWADLRDAHVAAGGRLVREARWLLGIWSGLSVISTSYVLQDGFLMEFFEGQGHPERAEIWRLPIPDVVSLVQHQVVRLSADAADGGGAHRKREETSLLARIQRRALRERFDAAVSARLDPTHAFFCRHVLRDEPLEQLSFLLRDALVKLNAAAFRRVVADRVSDLEVAARATEDLFELCEDASSLLTLWERMGDPQDPIQATPYVMGFHFPGLRPRELQHFSAPSVVEAAAALRFGVRYTEEHFLTAETGG
jgi:hypothetical protein